MTELTRRRDPEAHQETWRVYYGDVHVGTIARSVGNPNAARSGIGAAASIRAAGRASAPAARLRPSTMRADFEAAWRVFSATRTDADFAAYRRQRAWTDWKYAMWDAGCKMPTQVPKLRSSCFCGAEIDRVTMHGHVLAAHLA